MSTPSRLFGRVQGVWVAAVCALCVGSAQSMVCIPLGPPSLPFSHYNPLSSLPLDVQTSLAIECIPGVPGETLNLKVSLRGTGSGQLHLLHRGSGERLQLALYKEAARMTLIDDQTIFHFSDKPLRPSIYWLSLYGRIPSGQNVSVGSYQLPMTYLLEY